ncbi:cobalamin (vitamin B12) biosynthesis CbiX protein [Dinoroseobacter shibae DFL 12 = DSM 16493]|jgi:sirohydrochlorin ferrochelatase|uniref:Cobalamin (Vitamin B12) biosynthesis CbiX protein n=1 Tax=Dinoroseobacter shibae (strain DSM 16493 / NCIMB 14021 / DFL 12) TaxID=398580 RepID=A8LLZ5_DINSH|nr:cobalamin (vitamin B12) biosynthesis CbiX protein [Dinoroseobacter shibae]ABV94904.1 cobalamin (vitamin B12) biosynthesis CbiX protein [Dinoroseobacter shibae DFL 12 = DSM 16493]URF46325.1 cobalamin biosynthesis protein CbiX [Dinoroseobacter shibae]URF50631.1 cobalamin biosynthesis protein CbiX [Dinoroseobacter shibae]
MPEAVLIAHGAPSDPEPTELALQQLARDVAAELPGWRVRGATVAAPGALERAFDGLSPEAVVFPVFMCDGWIIRRILPDCLAAIGRAGTRVLTPLGQVPGFRFHCAQMLTAAMAEAGLTPSETTVVLAAHGSARGPIPEAWAAGLARDITDLTDLRMVIPAYLEQAPYLADVLAMVPGPAICLPGFATNAGHAMGDVPEAIAQSHFAGLVLPTVGTTPGIVHLIARELQASEIAEVAA